MPATSSDVFSHVIATFVIGAMLDGSVIYFLTVDDAVVIETRILKTTSLPITA